MAEKGKELTPQEDVQATTKKLTEKVLALKNGTGFVNADEVAAALRDHLGAVSRVTGVDPVRDSFTKLDDALKP